MTATAYTWVDRSGNRIIDASGNSLVFFNSESVELSAYIDITELNASTVSTIPYKNSLISAEKYNNTSIGVS